MPISKIGLDQGGIRIQFEMHFGDGFVGGFAPNFVDGGRHGMVGIDHGPIPGEREKV